MTKCLSKDAWARPTPEVADNGAVYVSVSNPGSQGDALIGASAERCASMGMHETTMEGDTMSMRLVREMVIPAGETMTMEPGDRHLMCIGLTRPLAQGEKLGLTLILARAGAMQATVIVENR